MIGADRGDVSHDQTTDLMFQLEDWFLITVRAKKSVQLQEPTRAQTGATCQTTSQLALVTSWSPIRGEIQKHFKPL